MTDSFARRFVLLIVGLAVFLGGMLMLTKCIDRNAQNIQKALQGLGRYIEQGIFGGVHVVVTPELEPVIVFGVGKGKSAIATTEVVNLNLAFIDDDDQPPSVEIGYASWQDGAWPVTLSPNAPANAKVTYEPDGAGLKRTFSVGATTHVFTGGYDPSLNSSTSPKVREFPVDENTLILSVIYRGYCDQILIHIVHLN